MEKVIQFKGISLDRSDQLSSIGELAFCHGAEIKNGALRPSVINRTLVGTLSGELLYVHETDNYTHYVCRDSGQLYYYDSASITVRRDLPTGNILHIENFTTESFGSMGNTIMLVSPGEGIYYVRWDTSLSTPAYVFLGAKPPFISMRFRPGARPSEPDYDQSDISLMDYDGNTIAADKRALRWTFRVVSDKASVDLCTVNPNRVDDECDQEKETDAGEMVWVEGDVHNRELMLGSPSSPKTIYIRSPYQSLFTESLWALINKTNDTIASKGRFYAPFFVRYVYRMYDGSVYCGSAPILVTPEISDLKKVFLCNVRQDPTTFYVTTNENAVFSADNPSGAYFRYRNKVMLSYHPVDFQLEYAIDSDNLADLRRWGDVIASVDVFISAPLVWYDDTELIKTITPDVNYAVQPTINVQGSPSQWRDDKRSDGFSGMDITRNYYIPIPENYPTSKPQRFEDVSVFYLLKSIKLDDLQPSAFSVMDVKESVVKNITTQEQLKTDEYGSFSRYIPAGQFTYNNRMHIFGISERLFAGFQPENMLQQYTGGTSYSISEIAVRLSTSDGIMWVRTPCSGVWLSMDLIQMAPMYYPDPRATLMQLKVNDVSYITIKMKEHLGLNGSITDIATVSFTSTNLYSYTGEVVRVDSDILVSQARNPFIFPALNASNVGSGTVLGLCTATRALSQGQFGSFPLIAFCTDGIWALDTAPDGSYKAVNPISREVCAWRTVTSGASAGITNKVAQTILQLDQSIMFTTDRGLCQLIGSEVVHVSDVLRGRPFDARSVTSMLPPSLDSSLTLASLAAQPLSDIPVINGSMKLRPLYDYVGRRLLIFPDRFLSADGKRSPCLVYSESDRQYTTMHTEPVRAILNHYPHPFIQYADGKVYSLSREIDIADQTQHPMLLLTRHISFGGYRDVISAIRHEKNFDSVPFLAILGSNDGVHDTLIGCFHRDHAEYLPGHPFRYFRILMALTMQQAQQYSSLILDITSKHSKL